MVGKLSRGAKFNFGVVRGFQISTAKCSCHESYLPFSEMTKGEKSILAKSNKLKVIETEI